MLKIAICDDQPQELEKIVAILNKYVIKHTLEAEIRTFNHPDVLLSAIENEGFHIYILDIVMPMLSGLELGREIRRCDHEAQIVYATTEPQFALQAYAASPLNYLIKPIEKQQMYDTLTLAISKVDLADEQTFTVKTTDSLRIINLSDILCCEYLNHTVTVTLINGEKIVSRTIRESFAEYILPLLNNRHFLQCRTSFVINMRRVERFSKDSFTLRGGKVVPIATKQYQIVRERYMDYLMKKEWC